MLNVRLQLRNARFAATAGTRHPPAPITRAQLSSTRYRQQASAIPVPMCARHAPVDLFMIVSPVYLLYCSLMASAGVSAPVAMHSTLPIIHVCLAPMDAGYALLIPPYWHSALSVSNP